MAHVVPPADLHCGKAKMQGGFERLAGGRVVRQDVEQGEREVHSCLASKHPVWSHRRETQLGPGAPRHEQLAGTGD